MVVYPGHMIGPLGCQAHLSPKACGSFEEPEVFVKTIEIVDLPSYKMVIFHSYVSYVS